MQIHKVKIDKTREISMSLTMRDFDVCLTIGEVDRKSGRL